LADSDNQTLLLDGARNLVRYVEIHSGQQVLIHTEPGYDDPQVVDAIKSAVEEGAQVCILHTLAPAPRGGPLRKRAVLHGPPSSR
jgi:hypothetical protein